MLQFLIIARDGIEPGSLERRLATRPFHLEGAAKLKASGNFVLGGATLDDQGNMNGSMMVVQFKTEEQMKDWLENEPYVRANVWQEVEVTAFKVAEV